MKEALNAIRAQILKEYKSIHAFCKKNPEIKRATVYAVLNNKYSSDTERQIKRIQAILDNTPFEEKLQTNNCTVSEMFTVLKEAKCAHCRRLNKQSCVICQTQTEREAQAIVTYLDSREVR